MRRHLLRQAGSLKAFQPACRRCPNQPLAPIGRRFVQVQAVPSFQPADTDDSTYASRSTGQAPTPDAQFEVLGHPYSLLSAKLSPSQNLFVRRGTLVGVSGRPNDAISTLSVLGPLRRTALGIPFLYQRISSTSPITALISTKYPTSSFSVIHLDGRLDWIVAQRSGLLAWTGHTLSIRPKANLKMSVAHWGNSHVTGRGLLALVGKGQIFQINLKENEQYVAHPSNVLAYTVNQNPPLPYRFKSTALRLQLPSLSTWLPDNRFVQTMRESAAWKLLAKSLFVARTWARRTVWGDRLFLQFQGPTTILLQSRGSSVTDALTNRDVNEIADAPVGAVQEAVTLDLRSAREETKAPSKSEPNLASRSAADSSTETPAKMRMATVRSGKVEIKDA